MKNKCPYCENKNVIPYYHKDGGIENFYTTGDNNQLGVLFACKTCQKNYTANFNYVNSETNERKQP